MEKDAIDSTRYVLNRLVSKSFSEREDGIVHMLQMQQGRALRCRERKW